AHPCIYPAGPRPTGTWRAGGTASTMRGRRAILPATLGAVHVDGIRTRGAFRRGRLSPFGLAPAVIVALLSADAFDEMDHVRDSEYFAGQPAGGTRSLEHGVFQALGGHIQPASRRVAAGRWRRRHGPPGLCSESGSRCRRYGSAG